MIFFFCVVLGIGPFFKKKKFLVLVLTSCMKKLSTLDLAMVLVLENVGIRFD